LVGAGTTTDFWATNAIRWRENAAAIERSTILPAPSTGQHEFGARPLPVGSQRALFRGEEKDALELRRREFRGPDCQ
jgi:hypothetical protein